MTDRQNNFMRTLLQERDLDSLSMGQRGFLQAGRIAYQVTPTGTVKVES